LLAFLITSAQNPISKPKVFVLVTDPKSDKEKAKKIAHFANTFTQTNLTFFLDIPIFKSDPEKPDYGYNLTDRVIDYLLEDHAECQYFLITNGDNLYAKGFIDNHLTKDVVG
jgi:hypothetical protein